ncbi:hypothetical protein H6F69_17795 [Leptolyngbya sp. FACHB-1624]|nr:hypothetical protein [Leptolyngbya sp. FACHB-1624]
MTMSFLSRSASVLVSLAGLVAVAAAPASAQNASVSGAITRTSPAGFTTTISGEIVAPEVFFIPGALTVTGSANEVNPALSVNAPIVPYAAPGAPSLLEQTVTAELNGLDTTTQAGLDAYAAILKSAVGVDGLE